jgi:hypothetical protein
MMLAFLFGLVLGLLLSVALLGGGLCLVLRENNRAWVAQVLHTLALALVTKKVCHAAEADTGAGRV